MNSGGMGKNRKNFGLGVTGKCVCPKCGYSEEHKRGIPCYEVKCPKCNFPLTREELRK